ncbi:MAG: aminoacyltransferase, partial [Delftia sp.]|nr:aminoacyltransferase [Delftia sp.]
MNVQTRAIDDPTTWNQTLLRLPRPHALQSWEWGAFKSRHGWTATRWKTDRAAALVLRRKLPRTPFSVLYVPKGPTLDYADVPAWEAKLAHMARLARSQRAIFSKIDPDAPREQSAVGQLLLTRGWLCKRSIGGLLLDSAYKQIALNAHFQRDCTVRQIV